MTGKEVENDTETGYNAGGQPGGAGRNQRGGEGKNAKNEGAKGDGAQEGNRGVEKTDQPENATNPEGRYKQNPPYKKYILFHHHQAAAIDEFVTKPQIADG